MAGAGHPFAASRSVGLADLLDFDWVMQSSGAPIRMALEDALLGMGARLPRRITNTSSLLVTIALLEASDTVAPVSREVASLLTGVGARPQIRVLPLRERIVVAPYLLLSTRGRRLSPIAQRCRDMVADDAAPAIGRPPVRRSAVRRLKSAPDTRKLYPNASGSDAFRRSTKSCNASRVPGSIAGAS